MIGVDLSPTCWPRPQKRTGMRRGSPHFLCQSMDQLDLYGTIDACVCCLDSINYVTDPKSCGGPFSGSTCSSCPAGCSSLTSTRRTSSGAWTARCFWTRARMPTASGGPTGRSAAHLHLWNGHLPAGSRRAVEPLGGGSRGVRLRTGGAGGVAPAGRFPADQTIRRAEVPRPQGGGAADFFAARKEF